MSDSVSTQFITQWDKTLRLAAQQKESRLRKTVTDRGQVLGSSFTITNLASVEMQENITRHGDTLWDDIDHTARNVVMRDFYKALPVDRADVAKMIVNPATGGQYMDTLIAARNRKIDDIIYSAALDPIIAQNGVTTYTLPAGQLIAAGGTAFTKAKIIQAKTILRANEADENDGEELFMLYDSTAMASIMSDTQLTSADFMATQMLQTGKISGHWMGFEWIPYERIRNVAGTKTTVAYAKSGIHFGWGFEEGRVSIRNDKKDSWQVSYAASYGAGRQDEKKVVSISFI